MAYLGAWLELPLHRNAHLAGGLQKWQAYQCRHTGHVHIQAQRSPHLHKYDTKAQPHKSTLPQRCTSMHREVQALNQHARSHKQRDTLQPAPINTHKERHTCTCARTHTQLDLHAYSRYNFTGSLEQVCKSTHMKTEKLL